MTEATKEIAAVRFASSITNSKEDLEYGPFHKWLKITNVVATVHYGASRAPKTVGEARALIINRAAIRKVFHESMEAPHLDTMNLALTIFDRYGRLKQELIEHTVRKGTGVWGEELGKGNFVLILNVSVSGKWRRKGIGSDIVLHTLINAMSSEERPKYAFVLPRSIYAAGSDQAETRAIKTQSLSKDRLKLDDINAFFRSLRFRRVGVTDWFALARDAGHPSRQLQSVEDANPTPDAPSDSDSDEEVAVTNCEMRMKESGTGVTFHQARTTGREAADPVARTMQEHFGVQTEHNRHTTASILVLPHPLHKAIKVMEDEECLIFLQSHAAVDAKDGLHLASTNGRGETILHAAAQDSKPKSLCWILESPLGVSLARTRDHSGYTPLEALQAKTEHYRICKLYRNNRAELMADKFDGYDEATVACLLKLLSTEDVTTAQQERVKFGCSCGLCASGFLSPRTAKKLRTSAEMLYDRLVEFVDSAAAGYVWFSKFKAHLTYLPDDLRYMFQRNIILRKAFTALTRAVGKCLCEHTVPCRIQVINFLKEDTRWSQVDAHYFQRGGSVAAIVNAVIDIAKKGTAEGEASIGAMVLPPCRNDDEFEFVRRHCIDDGPAKTDPEKTSPFSMPWLGFSESTFDRLVFSEPR